VLEFEAVPEPSTWWLLIAGGGLLALVALRHTRQPYRRPSI
jgi:PEP-CTERM motif